MRDLVKEMRTPKNKQQKAFISDQDDDMNRRNRERK